MTVRSADPTPSPTRRAAERVGEGGHGLVGLLQALAGLCLLLGLGATQLLPSVRGRSVDSAARGLAARCRVLAARALAEGRETALVFPTTGTDEPIAEWVDGDGDGVTRADTDALQDVLVERFTLSRDLPGTSIGRPLWPSIANVPPGTGRLTPADAPVRFGPSRMVVFDPEGHATPGTVFVTDGSAHLCAVVVAGATARVRIWCYDPREDSWQRH